MAKKNKPEGVKEEKIEKKTEKIGGKRVAPPTAPLLLRRELGAVIFLFLGIFTLMSYASVDALFIKGFSTFLKGCFGVGFWMVAPIMFVTSYILFTHQKGSAVQRVVCIQLIPLCFSCFCYGLISKDLRLPLSDFSGLWQQGLDLKGCGLFGSVIATVFTTCFSSIGSVLIFTVCLFFLGLGASNRTLMDLVDWFAARPAYEPPVKDPNKKPFFKLPIFGFKDDGEPDEEEAPPPEEDNGKIKLREVPKMSKGPAMKLRKLDSHIETIPPAPEEPETSEEEGSFEEEAEDVFPDIETLEQAFVPPPEKAHKKKSFDFHLPKMKAEEAPLTFEPVAPSDLKEKLQGGTAPMPADTQEPVEAVDPSVFALPDNVKVAPPSKSIPLPSRIHSIFHRGGAPVSEDVLPNHQNLGFFNKRKNVHAPDELYTPLPSNLPPPLRNVSLEPVEEPAEEEVPLVTLPVADLPLDIPEPQFTEVMSPEVHYTEEIPLETTQTADILTEILPIPPVEPPVISLFSTQSPTPEVIPVTETPVFSPVELPHAVVSTVPNEIEPIEDETPLSPLSELPDRFKVPAPISKKVDVPAPPTENTQELPTNQETATAETLVENLVENLETSQATPPVSVKEQPPLTMDAMDEKIFSNKPSTVESFAPPMPSVSMSMPPLPAFSMVEDFTDPFDLEEDLDATSKPVLPLRASTLLGEDFSLEEEEEGPVLPETPVPSEASIGAEGLEISAKHLEISAQHLEISAKHLEIAEIQEVQPPVTQYEAPVTETPKIPERSEIPERQEVPEVPEVQDISEPVTQYEASVTETPVIPEIQETPEIPERQEVPEVQDIPEPVTQYEAPVTETPMIPEIPERQEVPERQEIQDIPQAVTQYQPPVTETPMIPEVPETPEVQAPQEPVIQKPLSSFDVTFGADPDAAEKDPLHVMSASHATGFQMPSYNENLKDPEMEKMEAQVQSQSAQFGNSVYKYPPLSLLKPASNSDTGAQQAELQENLQRLEATLQSFKIKAQMKDVIQGPSVTRYEVSLQQGEKLSKLTNLSEDIALALGASGVRIAPIADKISTVGIEVPNKSVAAVEISQVLSAPQFANSPSKVSFAVGKDITGQAVVGNIAKMPHLLVAGTTGSGKSVCTNSLIISLLYKASPAEVKLIMVDPKMVELGIYNGIPHLLIPVVTDPKKAAGALQWAVYEMMKRYKLFSEVGTRDLASYNEYAKSQGQETMPQIVVIIDELADLMLVAAKEVEESICRVAQMGRASGMHLIIATQRPSADVITGLMKANIPSRIAFAVSSGMDSRIILDVTGAEKLVGRGDMLYAPLGEGKPTRVQGCLISDSEVAAVVNYVKKESGTATYSEEIMEQIDQNVAAKEKSGSKNSNQPTPDLSSDEQDEMLYPAIEKIMETKQASVSMLQRKLKLGYARAARILDSIEDLGIVGGSEGAKGRAILITPEQWQEMKYRRGQAGETSPSAIATDFHNEPEDHSPPWTSSSSEDIF